MEDAIPLTLWMIDLESASNDLGKRSDLGRMKDAGVVWNGGGSLEDLGRMAAVLTWRN